MRRWRGALLAALVATAGIGNAQAQDRAGQHAAADSDVTAPGVDAATGVPGHAPDAGWYAGLKFGLGDPAMSRQPGGVELFHGGNGGWPMEFVGLETGIRLTSRWKLGAELGIRAALRLPTGTEPETSNLDAVATYYPTEQGLFVRGGMGVAARFDHYWRHTPVSDRVGLDVRAGAGYEWLVWKALTVKAGLDTTRQLYRLGHGFASWSSYTTLYAGVGWR